MKIVTFNWHTPYLHMLAGAGNHKFDVAPPEAPGRESVSWDENMRPQPANVTLVSRRTAFDRLAESGYYDLLIAHNIKDIIATVTIDLPKILVFHNNLSTEAALGNKSAEIDDYRKSVRTLVSGVNLVFISETKRRDWRLAGEVIFPGIDVEEYGGFSGEEARALCVGNGIAGRDLMTGFTLQKKVLADFPNTLLGDNPDIPGSTPSVDWNGLKEAYRKNRLFFHSSMPPWEDGYNLALLEAMATGMPVVSMANPTSPITDGENGFVSDDPEVLKRRVRELLEDKELAFQVGEKGRGVAKTFFPISRFREKWNGAIERAVDLYPHPPRPFFTTRKKSVSKAAFAGAAGKKIILSYTSYPATAAVYLDKALKAQNDVVTLGCAITPEIIKLWNLQNLKEKAKPQDIPTPDLTVDIGREIEQLPDGADLFLWIETGLGRAPSRLDLLDMPKAAYFIDTHLNLQKHLEDAKAFDYVFLAQRAYIPEFNRRGMKNVFWLPLACDPEIHGKVGLPKENEVGFVGSMGDERRAKLLLKLAEKADVRYERAFLKDMTAHFCRSKIVFNNAIKNDLNMRVFEALCSGTMLLTDYADGIDLFFTDTESLVIYDDMNIADLARYYLENDDERERIAETGRQLVLREHTYKNRGEAILVEVFRPGSGG